jgi:glycosyltransferase involved in cell wall biosynthesis
MKTGIEFAGHLPYDVLMARVEAEADILVHPSLVEAQPMALIEAMARRIPVIGGKASGGVPWTLDDGRAGLLVDVRSPEEVSAAMIKLAGDPELRRGLSQKAQDLVRKRFHIAAVTDAYQSVYAQLAEGG